MAHLSDRERELFDQQLELVLDRLPDRVHEFLEEVPLVVDDAPSPELAAELGCDSVEDLCGLYTGVPLIDRTVDAAAEMPDSVAIFRLGILRLSAEAHPEGKLSKQELRRQIRITILHELGHHFGLDEDELDELGYG